MALQVLLLTGQRPGEVTRVRYDQITDGWWTLPGAPEPKTGWKGTKNGVTQSRVVAAVGARHHR
jgi:hypothetical protein